MSFSLARSVKNPRTGGLSALKRIPRVFQSLLSCVRTFREIKMLCELKHDNVRPSTLHLLIGSCIVCSKYRLLLLIVTNTFSFSNYLWYAWYLPFPSSPSRYYQPLTSLNQTIWRSSVTCECYCIILCISFKYKYILFNFLY